MLKLKLSPTGKKNEKHYRIVVLPDRSKLTGRVIAQVGHFHPLMKDESRLVVDKAAVAAWIAKGAQPTDKIRKLLNL